MALLTQPETAIETRLSPRSIERHRLAGTGPKFVRLGRRIFYRREDVEAWIADCTSRSTSEADAKAARRDESATQVPDAVSENVPQADSKGHEATYPDTPPVRKGAATDSGSYRSRTKNGGYSSGHNGIER